jgi:pimeloyl-ACP methyl ester carboxylesterase
VADERTYEVDGLQGPVPVVEQGGGRVILIVHGGTGDLTAWAGVADRLASGFRVLRYTRPTYRLQPAPRGAAAAEIEVADALAVARTAGGPVLIVGHSSGAVVALEAALADPGSIAAQALYEPPLDVTHSSGGAAALRRARAALDAGKPMAAMRIHLHELVGMPRRVVLPITLLPGIRKLFGSFADAQIADNEMLDALPVGMERYAALHQPTLLITGEKSPQHLRARTADLAGVLPQMVDQVTLAGQGHGANLGAPDALASAIAAFADQVLRSGGGESTSGEAG